MTGARSVTFGPAPAIAVVPFFRAGDFILATGLFNAIKQRLPGAELTVVVHQRQLAMARHHPAIDRVLEFERHPLRLVPFLLRLRGRRYDAWLDPKDHFSRNQTLLARFARAGVKVGFNRPGGGPFDLPVLPSADPSKHFAEKMMAPLDLIGMPWDHPPRLSLGLPPESVARVTALLVDRAPLEILANVSAGMAIRYWPEEKWAELLPRLARLRPARFWLSSAPEDDALAERIVATVGRGGTAIRQLPKGSLL
ncbi:MAG: glycosyltransferase family 9 protein, partial [Gemmatimonadales bacterium]